MVDNLLDLTHLAFVHDTTIGNLALAEHAKVQVTRAPNNVVVTRWIIDQEPPPTFKKVGGFTGNVDRWQIIDFVPPAFLRLDVGATPTGTGAPEGKRVGGIGMRNLNAITPETETTSHYFWGQAHDFDVKNAETTEKIFQQIKTAFLEDVSVFSAQQRNLNMIANPPQVDINADAGTIAARRILSRLYDEEQGASAGRGGGISSSAPAKRGRGTTGAREASEPWWRGRMTRGRVAAARQSTSPPISPQIAEVASRPAPLPPRCAQGGPLPRYRGAG